MTFFTCFCDFPQNEHFSRSESPILAMPSMSPPGPSGRGGPGRPRRTQARLRAPAADRRPEAHDPVLQQARVDVERALAAAGLLDDDGNEVVLHDASSGLSSGVSAGASGALISCAAPPSGVTSACSTSTSSAFERMIST